MDERTKEQLKAYWFMARELAAVGLLKLGEGLAELSKIVRNGEKV